MINPIRWKSQYFDNESGLYYIGNRYYSTISKQFISAVSLDIAMANAGTVYGLNLFLLTTSNPVNMIYNGHTIETSIPLTWIPKKLTKWEYFWGVAWPNFWNSPFGKGLAIGIFILAIVLTTFISIASAGAWVAFLKTLAWGAGLFTAGATIAGFRSMNEGNGFFAGFTDYINDNWSQSLAITFGIYIVALGVGALVHAASPKCFKAGTKILTATGYKVIEDIEVGDKVWSYDEDTGENSLKEVVRLFRNGKEFVTNVTKDIGEGVKEWIKVGISSLKNNDLITCTAEHPFYVLNASSERTSVIFEGFHEQIQESSGSWIASKDLKIGDELLLSNGENAIISSVEVEYYDDPQTTYNFEVEDFHTYYVGENGVLVHNVCEIKYADLPDEAKYAYDAYSKNGWQGNVSGQTTNAGGVYKNSTQLLPTKDSVGNILKYREFDIGMTMPRGASRFVVSNQMTVYYTPNHYATFFKVVF